MRTLYMMIYTKKNDIDVLSKVWAAPDIIVVTLNMNKSLLNYIWF